MHMHIYRTIVTIIVIILQAKFYTHTYIKLFTALIITIYLLTIVKFI